MPETSSVRPARRPSKPGGKKTANRFLNLAGGDDKSDVGLPGATDDATDSGVIGGMSAIAADIARRVVEIAVADVAPHPFNDASRSLPQPGDSKWEELVNAVRANGVRLPVLVVSRDAFVSARPTSGAAIAANAKYVLIYGHRRRAAAITANRDGLPAVVDDTILADNGDLDAMAAENLGRQDLSELAEADLYARYSDIGLSQRAIAERLGVDQATVSRRLALLLLAPETRQAVRDDILPSAEAAALAGKLPYGPHRKWQKSKDIDQDTAQRRTEQVEAHRFMTLHNWPASRAADRVVAERESRAQAASLGVDLVEDPRVTLGHDYLSMRLDPSESAPGADAVGAINRTTGHLELYSRSMPSSAGAHDQQTSDIDHGSANAGPPEGSTPAGVSDDARDLGSSVEDAAPAPAEPPPGAAAQAHRRDACIDLAHQQPTNPELLRLLVRQCLSGISARAQSAAATTLLRQWGALTVDGTGERARYAEAWRRSVAAAELHLVSLGESPWDRDAVAHIELLVDRVGYEPTDWEASRLGGSD